MSIDPSVIEFSDGIYEGQMLKSNDIDGLGAFYSDDGFFYIGNLLIFDWKIFKLFTLNYIRRVEK